MKSLLHKFYNFIGYEPPVFSKVQARQIVDLFEKYYDDRVVGLEEKLRNVYYKLPIIDFGPGDSRYTLEFFKDEFVIIENEPLQPGAIRVRFYINGFQFNTHTQANVNINVLSSAIQAMLGTAHLKTTAPTDLNIIFRGELKVSEIERGLKSIKLMEVIEK